MVVRLNKSLEYRQLIPTPDWSGPGPSSVPFYTEHSTPPVLSTMREKTLLRCPEVSCRKKLTSDSWLFIHIKLHHPDHNQVANNLTVCSVPRWVERAHHCQFNGIEDSVVDLDSFPHLEHIENIADLVSHPPPPSLRRTETFPAAGALMIDYAAKPWESDNKGCLETNIPNTHYYPFVTRAEYQYIQCVIKKRGMRTYHDNVLKEENTTLHFPWYKTGDDVQKLVASMPDDQALGEWELHTLEDIRWNDNHQRPVKYWSPEIVNSMRWLMGHPACAEHVI